VDGDDFWILVCSDDSSRILDKMAWKANLEKLSGDK
jgi:hypothetical protein